MWPTQKYVSLSCRAHRFWWRRRSSGIWRRTDWQIVTDVSKQLPAILLKWRHQAVSKLQWLHTYRYGIISHKDRVLGLCLVLIIVGVPRTVGFFIRISHGAWMFLRVFNVLSNVRDRRLCDMTVPHTVSSVISEPVFPKRFPRGAALASKKNHVSSHPC
jgi:hypothetical protein